MGRRKRPQRSSSHSNHLTPVERQVWLMMPPKLKKWRRMVKLMRLALRQRTSSWSCLKCNVREVKRLQHSKRTTTTSLRRSCSCRHLRCTFLAVLAEAAGCRNTYVGRVILLFAGVVRRHELILTRSAVQFCTPYLTTADCDRSILA